MPELVLVFGNTMSLFVIKALLENVVEGREEVNL